MVLIGLGFFEALQASRLTVQNEALAGKQQQLTDQAVQASRQRDDATEQLAALESENQQLRAQIASLKDAAQQLADLKAQNAAAASDPTQAALMSWLDRVSRIKMRLSENPNLQIPEMQYLNDQDWLNSSRANLNTDEDYRKALGQLRDAAESAFQKMLSSALTKYLTANNQQFPTDLSQLQSYFDTPVDDSILARWEIGKGFNGNQVIWLKAPVDREYDSRFGVQANGTIAIGAGGWGPPGSTPQ
jgi:flagellar biosynthesis GTPase FlhF